MSDLNSTNSSLSNGAHHPDYDTFIISLLAVLAVLIFAANSFVIYLYLHRSELKTITNLCLVFLAISDLLAAVVVIPIVILAFKRSSLSTFFVIASDFASRFVAFSTVFHLLLVSLERYIMIVFPMRYSRIVNKKRVKACLIFLWCFSLALVLIQLSWILPLTGENSNTSRADLVYSTTTFLGIIVPVFLLLVLVYCHIYREVHRQIKNIRKSTPVLLTDDPQAQQQSTKKDKRREARAVIIFALMMCAFVVGWFPYFILGVLSDFMVINTEMSIGVALLFCMRFVVSFVNPLLYTFLKEDFKKALRKTFPFRSRRDIELNNRI